MLESELILRPDGSLYHLGLKPEHATPLIITVGDPDRVAGVSKHFDSITFKQQTREFVTHVGTFAGNKIMCISTGIGTDNVDIVFNELDALVNIDFATRKPKESLQSLTFLRLGTSGTFQADIPVDTILLSDGAIGLDGLGPFYPFEKLDVLESFSNAYPAFAKTAYAAAGTDSLASTWQAAGAMRGYTLTCSGFYGPQRRSVRLPFVGPDLSELATFRFGKDQRLTNFEMETAGIYGLSNLLGHRALSVSAILANRATGKFSDQAGKTVEDMIEKAFELLKNAPEVWWE
ncbi:MAG: nucleoside phosphorylase [Saprospiraceae bacterium]